MSDALNNDINEYPDGVKLEIKDTFGEGEDYVVIDERGFSLDAIRFRFNDPDEEFEGVTLFSLEKGAEVAMLLSGFGLCEKLYLVSAKAYFEFLDEGEREFKRHLVVPMKGVKK